MWTRSHARMHSASPISAQLRDDKQQIAPLRLGQPAVERLAAASHGVTRQHRVAHLLTTLRPDSPLDAVKDALLGGIGSDVLAAFDELRQQCAAKNGLATAGSACALADLPFYVDGVHGSVGFAPHANSWLRSSSAHCAVRVFMIGVILFTYCEGLPWPR
jgi:hypothetical protein